MSEQGQEFHDNVTRPGREVLARLREEIVIQPKQPDEFTVSEAAEMFGLEFKTAEYRIKKLEREGVVESRRAAQKRFYRFVD